MAKEKANAKPAVTARQKDVLNVLAGLNAGKEPATIAAVASKLNLTSGPVYNHLIALRDVGFAAQRAKEGKTVAGSWYITAKGRRAAGIEIRKNGAGQE